MRRMIRAPTLFAVVSFLLGCNASALEVVEKEGFLVYFPKYEAELDAIQEMIRHFNQSPAIAL